MSAPHRSRLLWLLMALIAVVAVGVGAVRDTGPRTPEERVQRLAALVKCPTCAGESVAESRSPSANTIRLEIARQVADGRSDDEILRSVVAAFDEGEGLLLTPPASGFGALVWVLPVVALICAFAGLAVAFRRWRPSGASVSEDDRDLVARALAGTDEP